MSAYVSNADHTWTPYLGVDHALVGSDEAEEAEGAHGQKTIEEHPGWFLEVLLVEYSVFSGGVQENNFWLTVEQPWK
jgi:hypothetical protein